jgi:hypothetical protein
MHTHTYTQYAYLYVCLSEERQRMSVTLVTAAAQVCASDLYMCARVYCVVTERKGKR